MMVRQIPGGTVFRPVDAAKGGSAHFYAWASAALKKIGLIRCPRGRFAAGVSFAFRQGDFERGPNPDFSKPPDRLT
jgi:hypothetical protein